MCGRWYFQLEGGTSEAVPQRISTKVQSKLQSAELSNCEHISVTFQHPQSFTNQTAYTVKRAFSHQIFCQTEFSRHGVQNAFPHLLRDIRRKISTIAQTAAYTVKTECDVGLGRCQRESCGP